MNAKLILGLALALVLSGVGVVFALAYSVQIKPAELSQHPDILIRSGLAAGCRTFCVVLMPQTNFPISVLKGDLEINEEQTVWHLVRLTESHYRKFRQKVGAVWKGTSITGR